MFKKFLNLVLALTILVSAMFVSTPSNVSAEVPASIKAFFKTTFLQPELHIQYQMPNVPAWLTIQSQSGQELPVMFTSSENHGENIYLTKIWGIEFHYGFLYFKRGEIYTIRIRTGSYEIGPDFGGTPLVGTTVFWSYDYFIPNILK